MRPVLYQVLAFRLAARAERVSSCNSGADPVDVPLIDVSQLLGIISANLRFSWSSLWCRFFICSVFGKRRVCIINLKKKIASWKLLNGLQSHDLLVGAVLWCCQDRLLSEVSCACARSLVFKSPYPYSWIFVSALIMLTDDLNWSTIRRWDKTVWCAEGNCQMRRRPWYEARSWIALKIVVSLVSCSQTEYMLIFSLLDHICQCIQNL